MKRPLKMKEPSRREVGGLKEKQKRKTKNSRALQGPQLIRHWLRYAALMPTAKGKALALNLFNEGLASQEEVDEAFVRNPGWRDA